MGLPKGDTMKSMLKILTVTAILTLSLVAGVRYNSAEEAAMNCDEITTCLADGYWMETCEPQPIYYIVPPEGNYQWGTVQVRLNCDQTTGKAPLVVTCYINARMNRKGRVRFLETHNHVQPIK